VGQSVQSEFCSLFHTRADITINEDGQDAGHEQDAEGKPQRGDHVFKRGQVERAARLERKRKPSNRTTSLRIRKKKNNKGVKGKRGESKVFEVS
jgi:hypothetical protein